jgi:hypothetical protein
MRFTLDTNCVIDLEEHRANEVVIRELIELHRANKIALAVPGISASENQPNSGYSTSFNAFLSKLSGVDLSGVEILKPPAYLDIGYFDQCVLADDNMVALERGIHEVLFPEIAFLWPEYESRSGLARDDALRKWPNAKCDTLGMWSYIQYKGDVFVTSDGEESETARARCASH